MAFALMADRGNAVASNLMQRQCEKVMAAQSGNLEMLAAAFLKETGLSASDCVLCQQISCDGTVRFWYESKETNGKRDMV